MGGGGEEQECELTGIRGSHILTLDQGLSLKNIEELVHEREAIRVAET